MGETTEPAQPAAETKLALTFGEILAALKDNFVLVSAAAVLVGIALSATFLASYLSVFDWHLIWFVQYPDIITFGLLAVGIVSGSVTFIQGLAQTVLNGKTAKQRRSGLIAVGLLAVFGITLNVWGAVHSGQAYFHIITGFLAFGTPLVVIYIIASHVEGRTQPTGIQWLFILLLIIGGAGTLGRWLGETVQETSDFNQDVYIKDQTLNGVKVVIVMSRHTVLLKDKVLYVVPTGDITKFQTADKNAKPKSVPEE